MQWNHLWMIITGLTQPRVQTHNFPPILPRPNKPTALNVHHIISNKNIIFLIQFISFLSSMLSCGIISNFRVPTLPFPTCKYSISDTDLESRGFLLRRTVSDLNLDQLNKIFVAVGFPRRDPEKIKLALQHTDSMLWVQYKKSENPVAFARATGDGVFNAIIWDVVVDPSFQGIGLGKVLMERLIDELLEKGICNIALYSEPRVQGFYRPLGFVSDPDGIKGMVYSRKQKKNKK